MWGPSSHEVRLALGAWIGTRPVRANPRAWRPRPAWSEHTRCSGPVDGYNGPVAERTWIFGYGSLIWRPDITHVERRAGWIDGWARDAGAGGMVWIKLADDGKVTSSGLKFLGEDRCQKAVSSH